MSIVYIQSVGMARVGGQSRTTRRWETGPRDESVLGQKQSWVICLFVCLFDLGGTSLVRPGADGGVFYA